MQNKKLYIILAVVFVVVAAAAFVGGRLLNGGVNPLGLFPMGGGRVQMSIDMIPAPELPTTEPEARGSFVERNDNTIIVQIDTMEMGKGGVVVSAGPAEGGGGGPITNQDGGESGPKVEVVITSETVIYCDVTDVPPPSEASETQTIQQEVEICSLDDLTSNTMVMVWGRKNGNRIIADVVVFNKPVIFKKGQ